MTGRAPACDRRGLRSTASRGGRSKHHLLLTRALPTPEQNNEGWTPLAFAARGAPKKDAQPSSWLKLAEALLAAGASTSPTTSKGFQPLHCAPPPPPTKRIRRSPHAAQSHAPRLTLFLPFQNRLRPHSTLSRGAHPIPHPRASRRRPLRRRVRLQPRDGGGGAAARGRRRRRRDQGGHPAAARRRLPRLRRLRRDTGAPPPSPHAAGAPPRPSQAVSTSRHALRPKRHVCCSRLPSHPHRRRTTRRSPSRPTPAAAPRSTSPRCAACAPSRASCSCSSPRRCAPRRAAALERCIRLAAALERCSALLRPHIRLSHAATRLSQTLREQIQSSLQLLTRLAALERCSALHTRICSCYSRVWRAQCVAGSRPRRPPPRRPRRRARSLPPSRRSFPATRSQRSIRSATRTATRSRRRGT